MELNRNHYFMLGIVVLLLGLQFRAVDSYVLNEKASEFVTKKFKEKKQAEGNMPQTLMATAAPAVQPRRTVRPPDWLGWSLISLGAVLILHSLAMKKPE